MKLSQGEGVCTEVQVLQDHKLYAKKSKCAFAKQSSEYLGHVVSGEGVSADPNKVTCMKEWLVPRTIKSLRGFLGLTSYYKKFVRE